MTTTALAPHGRDSSLPAVGLGIDLLNDGPHINALLRDHRGLYDYVEVFDGGNFAVAEQFAQAMAGVLPILYHNPVLNVAGDTVAPARVIRDAAACASVLQAAWCVEEMGYNRVAGCNSPYFMPAVLTRANAALTANNLRTLQAAFACDIAFETPAFEIVFGDIGLGEFIRRVVDETGSNFVLDLTHVLSYAKAIGADVTRTCLGLPLDRVIEVHLSGGVDLTLSKVDIFRDTHGSARVPAELYRCLTEISPRMTALRAVTVEVDGGAGAFAGEELTSTRRAIGLSS